MIKVLLKSMLISSIFTLSGHADERIQNYIILGYVDPESTNYPQGELSRVVSKINCRNTITNLTKNNFFIQERYHDENYAIILVQKGKECKLDITEFEFYNADTNKRIHYKTIHEASFSIPLNKDAPIWIEENENRTTFETEADIFGKTSKIILSAGITGDWNDFPNVTPIIRIVYN